MVLGLTHVDFKNSGWNTLQLASHFIGGFAVTGAINGFAHKIVGLKKESNASNVCILLSLAAGVGVSVVYLTPRSTFVEMAWGKVAKLVGMHVIAMFAVNKVLEDSWIFLVPTLIGSLSGGGGRHSLYTAGVLGALLGLGVTIPDDGQEQPD